MNSKKAKRSVIPPLLRLGVALVPILFWGCQQKREVQFVQGDGENLYFIEEFLGRAEDQMLTKDVKFRGITSRADTLQVHSGFEQIRSFDEVGFEIRSPLVEGVSLGDLKIYGMQSASNNVEEPFAYDIEYSFTDKYIIFSKVSAKEFLPSQEMTYALPRGDGRFSVAMFGLPISLYTVEKVEDSRGKDTRSYRTFAKDQLKEATHFRVDKGAIKFFDAPMKLDLLQAGYFENNQEWYYTKTLIGRPINSQARLGSQDSALRMKLIKTKNSVLGVDLNIAPEQVILDPQKLAVALEIPVQWVDFRTVVSGSDANLKQELVTDEDPGARFWSEREYALVDFNNADRLERSKTQENKLEKLEIGDNYIGFNIYESDTGFTWKYSLVKASDAVAGTSFKYEDRTYFHLFDKVQRVIHGSLTSQIADREKLHNIARYYPRDGVIQFHITDNTPDEPTINDAIKEAVEAWADAFAKAGTGIRIELNDKRVEMGDVRYNKITFYGYEIDSREGTGTLLGFGPNVGDDRTGEVFTATTNMYLRAYRESVINSIRSYVRSELEQYNGKGFQFLSVVDKATQDAVAIAIAPINDALGQKAVRIAEMLPLSSEDLPYLGANIYTNGLNLQPKYASPYELYEALSEQRQLQAQQVNGYRENLGQEQKSTETYLRGDGSKCSFGVSGKAVPFQKIGAECIAGNRSKLAAYITDLKSAHAADPNILNLADESDAILDCAQRLMKYRMKSTLMHELGHNFGLGHNFAASSDPNNFPKHEGGQRNKYLSSSVMDYPDDDVDLYNEVGPYDIAALRLAYSRTIETVEGDFVSIPVGSGVAETLRSLSKSERKFRVCEDAKAGGNSPAMFDPLCSKWDTGGSPVEAVNWAISSIVSDFTINGYRYNNFGEPGLDIRPWLNMQQIYEYFRSLDKIFKDTRLGNYFQQAENPERFAALLEKIVYQENPQDQELHQYYEASQKVFEFARAILFYPGRVCVLSYSSGAVELVEFPRLQVEVLKANGPYMKDCELEAAYAFIDRLGLSQTGGSLQSVKQIGLPEQNVATASGFAGLGGEFTSGLGRGEIYSLGTLQLKQAALDTLVGRVATFRPNLRQPDLGGAAFRPSFLDDPRYRQDLIRKLMDRMRHGLDLNVLDTLPKAELGLPLEESLESIYSFESSRAALGAVWRTLRERVDYPDTNGRRTLMRTNPLPRLSNDRVVQAWQVVAPQIAEGRETSIYAYDSQDALHTTTLVQNPYAYSLLEKYVHLSQARFHSNDPGFLARIHGQSLRQVIAGAVQGLLNGGLEGLSPMEQAIFTAYGRQGVWLQSAQMIAFRQAFLASFANLAAQGIVDPNVLLQEQLAMIFAFFDADALGGSIDTDLRILNSGNPYVAREAAEQSLLLQEVFTR